MNRTKTDLTPAQLREYAEYVWNGPLQHSGHINRFEPGYNTHGVAIKAGRPCGEGLTPAQRAWRKRHPGVYGSDAARAALLATAQQTVDPDNGFTVYRFGGVDVAVETPKASRKPRSVKSTRINEASSPTPLDAALAAFRALSARDREEFVLTISDSDAFLSVTQADDEALASLEREIDVAAVGERAPARVASADWSARLKKLQGL